MSAIHRDPSGLDSDSDDTDYVPTTGNHHNAGPLEENGPDGKRARTGEPPESANDDDAGLRKQAREKAWTTFQESLASPAARKDSWSGPLVKIKKTHRFAGEDVYEVVEVPDGSDDAKKWPLWDPTADVATSTNTNATSSAPSLPHATASKLSPVASVKKPGRRKPKIQLGDIPSASSQKMKKITTLQKSAIDWRAHVDRHPDSDLKDELEANRRGGGYLDKVRFLDDVGDRRGRLLEESKGRKRKHG
ncbi:hypothetical protein K488DRAFT_86916 [Vararia minispora EC-137]|uniref:Uncharacterized protein n=1 Tax=Vararia minispora EC-137 TaxID=1314806 RepID=A0ACB8QHU8_9AGAM|nr:hypothetical protein K488DRAFT_86916 [Vararia minispora EC-137]